MDNPPVDLDHDTLGNGGDLIKDMVDLTNKQGNRILQVVADGISDLELQRFI